MARPPRHDHPRSLHHVTARGIARRTLFVDDGDRIAFLAALGLVVRAEDWRCLAYCLMGNHFHLLVQVGDRGLSAGMHRLNGRCAQRFNRLYGVTGHVFDRRFANQPITRQVHLLEVVRYLHLNPVRAGLCALPGLWPWSSYRAIAGRESAPTFLDARGTLDLFGPLPGARAAFEEFVADGLRDPEPREPNEYARPELADLVRTMGLEGGLIAHLRYRYPQALVAEALGVSRNTFRRELQRAARRMSTFEPGAELATRAAGP
jgi:REP element-mobilizing transposase RayT